MTVNEVEEKKIQLETALQTALEAAKVLTPATPEFDEAYGRYLASKAELAKIPSELQKAKLVENAEAIKTAGNTVTEAIFQLTEGLKVAELLGSPVIALRYYRTVGRDEAGKESVSTGVVFNPVAQLKTKRAPKESKGVGRTVIRSADGTKTSLTKFVLDYATEDEKASARFKYPHTVIDTKPKFDLFCEKHNLRGFVYEVPTPVGDS